MTMVSRKNVTAAVRPFWMHFVVSLHYISPSTNPLHIMPIGQGPYSNGQSFPANAKRNTTTRVRKRPMKGNSVVPDMPRVMLGKGKRVNTRGSEALVTWGVQFNRETLLEDKRLSRMGYVHRVGGSLRLFLVGPEMAPLTVNDRAVSWLF